MNHVGPVSLLENITAKDEKLWGGGGQEVEKVSRKLLENNPMISWLKKFQSH